MLHTRSNSILLTTHRRLRRCVALGTVAALATFGASTAQAKTHRHYTSVIQNMAISTAHGYPAVGGTAVLAGTWWTSLFGNGALVDHVTITGNPAPLTFAFKGTEVGYLPRGTFTDSFTGTSTVGQDGIQTVVTKGRITAGTGAYRGATGSFKFNGSTVPGSSVLGGHSSGTIAY